MKASGKLKAKGGKQTQCNGCGMKYAPDNGGIYFGCPDCNLYFMRHSLKVGENRISDSYRFSDGFCEHHFEIIKANGAIFFRGEHYTPSYFPAFIRAFVTGYKPPPLPLSPKGGTKGVWTQTELFT